MPNTTIPTPASAPPSLLPRSSRDSTPLGSPSLATYQPPEEFQEGSSPQGYFDGVEEGEGELDHPRGMNHERFEQDAALFFKDEPTFTYEAGKETRLNTEEEEDEEDDEGDLPGLLADSDEDGDEDARELRGAIRGPARRAQRRAAWGPEWNDAVPAEVADGGDVAVEADDDGEDVEGEEVDDAALAAQLADEDLAVEDDMEGALEGKVSSYSI
jgi:E3 ubiquitin-protein ligase MARCH6